MDNRGCIVFKKNKKTHYKRKLGVGILILSSVLIGALILSAKVINGALVYEDKVSPEKEEWGVNVPKVLKKIKPSIVTIMASNGEEEEQCNYATGIVYDNGLILTGNHVVDKMKNIKIRLFNGKIIEAVKQGSDTLFDLAVLRINKEEMKGLKAIKFADEKAELGQDVVIYSSDFINGWETVDKGIISSLREQKFKYNDKIYKLDITFTDATASVDNDGAVIVNSKGEMLGMNNFELNNRLLQYDYATSVSAQDIKRAVDNLVKYGFVSKSKMGIIGGSCSSASKLLTAGVYIHEINKDSNADKAGLRPTDVILEINGVEIFSVEQINELIDGLSGEKNISLKIRRNNLVQKMEVSFDTEEE